MVQTKSRIGLRYEPSQPGFGDPARDEWIDRLHGLEANWLYILAPVDRAIPESFLKGLIETGIEPILHLPLLMGAQRPAELNPILYSYAHWGVNYVIVHDRPNQKDQWTGDGWSRRDLVARYLDLTLPTLQAQQSSGLTPTLPPLEPGGDYWDTAFLESVLKGLARRGQRDLLDQLVLTCYAWSQGRSLTWGAGGPRAWPQARPYYPADEGEQDHCGFRIFEWYEQISQDVLGSSRPVLAVGAGAQPGEEAFTTTNGQIASELEDPQFAVPLEAACFINLPEHGHRSPKDEPGTTNDAAPKYEALANSPVRPKTISHYLLLPAEESRAVPAWRRASAFALTHRPVVGFSPSEAALAEQVTIAANPDVIPLDVEEALRAAGCRVQRMSLLPQRKSACRPGSPGSAAGQTSDETE